MRREESLKNITTGAVTVGMITIVVWFDFHVPLLGKVLAFFLPVIMAFAGLKTNDRTFFIMVIASTFTMYLVVTNPLYPISRGLISFLIESLPLIWCIRHNISRIKIILLITFTLVIHWFLDLLTIQLLTGIPIFSSINKMATELTGLLHVFHLQPPGNQIFFIVIIISVFIIRAVLVAIVYTVTTTSIIGRIK